MIAADRGEAATQDSPERLIVSGCDGGGEDDDELELLSDGSACSDSSSRRRASSLATFCWRSWVRLMCFFS